MRSKCAKIGHWFFRCLTLWLFDLTGGTTCLNTLLNIFLLLMRTSSQLPGWNSFTPGSTEERIRSISPDGIYDATEVLLLCFPRFPLLLVVNHISIILDSSARLYIYLIPVAPAQRPVRSLSKEEKARIPSKSIEAKANREMVTPAHMGCSFLFSWGYLVGESGRLGDEQTRDHITGGI